MNKFDSELHQLAERIAGGLRPAVEEATTVIVSTAVASVPIAARLADEAKDRTRSLKEHLRIVLPNRALIIEPTRRVGWERITNTNPSLQKPSYRGRRRFLKVITSEKQ